MGNLQYASYEAEELPDCLPEKYMVYIITEIVENGGDPTDSKEQAQEIVFWDIMVNLAFVENVYRREVIWRTSMIWVLNFR